MGHGLEKLEAINTHIAEKKEENTLGAVHNTTQHKSLNAWEQNTFEEARTRVLVLYLSLLVFIYFITLL